MARPQKEGLLYFPFDVDTFDDDKLFDVQNEFGTLGESIYFRLLCLVYKDKGYYYEFKSLDKLASILIKSIGNRWVKNKQTVIQVILYLAECNLFSSELMQNNVITSVGIQQRYAKATERRQFKDKKYWLLSENDESLIIDPITIVNVDNNSINVDNNDTKESKGNKRKVNKSKGENKGPRFTPPSLEEIKAYCLERNNNINPEKFLNHYEARGWQLGRGKMKDWKAAVRTWELNGYDNPKPTDDDKPGKEDKIGEWL